LVLFAALAALAATLSGCEGESLSFDTMAEFREYIDRIDEADEAEGQKLVKKLWEAVLANDGVPLVFGSQVAFLYRGEAETVVWEGDFNQWGLGGTLQGRNVGGTDLWMASFVLPIDARANYRIVLDEVDEIVDPANPHRQAGLDDESSVVVMPEFAVTMDTAPREDIEAGEVSEAFVVDSESLGYQVAYRVYTPAGYSQLDGLPTLYVLDGNEFLAPALGAMATVLDNLIGDDRIDPVLAVFIDATDPRNPAINRRELDFLTNAEDFGQFVARELVPAIDAAYRTERSADSRIIAGISFGGFAASYITALHSEQFHKAAMYSPPFWLYDFPDGLGDLVPDLPMLGETIRVLEEISQRVNEALACSDETTASCPAPLDVFMSAGIPEWDVGDSPRDTAASFEQQGVPHLFIEVREGHNWGHWSGLLDEMLVYFFGARGS
jgi:enterochelin esterase-like enzyme